MSCAFCYRARFVSLNFGGLQVRTRAGMDWLQSRNFIVNDASNPEWVGRTVEFSYSDVVDRETREVLLRGVTSVLPRIP